MQVQEQGQELPCGCGGRRGARVLVEAVDVSPIDTSCTHTRARSRGVFGLRHVCRAGLIRPAEYGQPTPPCTTREPRLDHGLAPSTNRPYAGCSLTDSVLSIGFGGCSCVWIASIVVTSIIEATNGERHGWCLEEGFGWLQWLHGRLVIVIDRRDYYDGGASSRPPFLNSAKNSCGSIG